jgi:serine protease Do
MRGLAFSLSLLLMACGQTTTAPREQSPTFSLPEASASTLRVVSLSGRDELSSGSGVAVAPNMVLTNRHVIANALEDGLNFQIFVFDNAAGFPRRVNAIIAHDPRLDLAVLYVRGITSAPVTFALAPPMQLESVTALGFPAATDEVFDRILESVSATSGQVTATDRGPVSEYGPIDLLMHTATVNPGNSGGPLFNACGQLAGINTLRGNPSETSNVFVSSSASEVVPFLRSYGVDVNVADSVCTIPGVQQAVCTFDRTALDAAITGTDLQVLDDAIRAVPSNCTEARSAGWQRRAELVATLDETFAQMAGTWRLPDAECREAIWLFQSGLSMVGYNGAQTQIERFVSASNGQVTTRTVHPDGDSSYRYSLNNRRLRIENLSSEQSWEFERCTG